MAAVEIFFDSSKKCGRGCGSRGRRGEERRKLWWVVPVTAR
jgi:hypothetical protein